jgi:Flp pilus assembly CpaE family ATPase
MSNKKRTVALALTTSPQDVYVVPASFKADVSSIFVSNGSDNTVNVTLQWYSAVDAVSYDIMDAVRMKPRSILQITAPLYLDKNDKITGFANVGSSTITVSIKTEEYFATKL